VSKVSKPKMTDAEKNERYQKNRKHVEAYIAKTYDDIKVRVPKGEREKIQVLAKKNGFDSVNSFIVAAIESYDKKGKA